MPSRHSIDGFEFSRTAAALDGRLEIADLPRLQDVLEDRRGAIEFSVRGVCDDQGRPAIEVKVSGVLRLRCQRCLEPFDFPLAGSSCLVLAATVGELDAATDDREGILADKEIEVSGLVEDEVLLAVPYAPRHARCAAPQTGRSAQAVASSKSAFSGLRKLLRVDEQTGRARRR